MKRVIGDCPLGSKCENVETRDNEQVIVTCPWYSKIVGTDAQGEEHDEWACAIAWQPILQLEMAGTNRGQTSAIESLRNETVKGQDKFNNILLSSIALEDMK